MNNDVYKKEYDDISRKVLGWLFSIFIISVLCLFCYSYYETNVVQYEIITQMDSMTTTKYIGTSLIYEEDGSLSFIDVDSNRVVNLKSVLSIKRR
jgi:hypothetical protein